MEASIFKAAAKPAEAVSPGTPAAQAKPAEGEKPVSEIALRSREDRKRRSEGLAVILAYLDTVAATLSPEVKAARAAFKRGANGGIKNPLFALFGAAPGQLPAIGATFSEEDGWRKMRFGALEVNVQRRRACSASDPTKRVWIGYDPKAQTYKVMAIGENAPAGYDGPAPMKPRASAA
jgi:hypothetical protein